jgi:hypothetical protein
LKYVYVVQRVKEERKILQKTKGKNANWIGHVLSKNCLLRHVIEGKVEGGIDLMERR